MKKKWKIVLILTDPGPQEGDTSSFLTQKGIKETLRIGRLDRLGEKNGASWVTKYVSQDTLKRV